MERRMVRGQNLMPTLIIVDDDPQLCSALQLKLERTGYEVCAVHTSQALLTRLEVHRPDLILLDLMMPDRSGVEVLE